MSSKPPPTVAGTADGGVAGVRGVGVRELNYRLAFLSSSVQVVDKGQGMVNIRGDETTNDVRRVLVVILSRSRGRINRTDMSAQVLAQFTEEQTDDLAKMANDPQIYSNLAKSIAPGVFGHEDVKRAILLMLFGGVHKTTRDVRRCLCMQCVDKLTAGHQPAWRHQRGDSGRPLVWQVPAAQVCCVVPAARRLYQRQVEQCCWPHRDRGSGMGSWELTVDMLVHASHAHIIRTTTPTSTASRPVP